MDHLIQQKLIMMDLNEVPEGHTPVDSDIYIPHAARLRKFLSAEDQDGIISPSSIIRVHISAPTLGKYMVEKALELLGIAHTHGFGDTVELVTPAKRKVKKFRKTPYDRLSADTRNVLQDIRISEDEYKSSFTPTPNNTGVPENTNVLSDAESEANKEN